MEDPKAYLHGRSLDLGCVEVSEAYLHGRPLGRGCVEDPAA
jgi:hypothetical protein